MKRRIRIVILVVAAIGMMASVVGRVLAGATSEPLPADVKAATRTVTPKSGSDERMALLDGNYIAGPGMIEPADRETKLAGEVAGRIASVQVKEGDRVKEGDALVTLEHAVESAAVEAADAEVAAAKADLTRVAAGLRAEDVEALDADFVGVKARARLSAKELERVQRLYEREAASMAELDAARTRADADRAQVSALESKTLAARRGRPEEVAIARARLAAAIARREQQRRTLERLTVRSPIAGEVLAIKVRAGEYYAPGQPNAEPLALLGDTRKLRIRMDVDERDVGKVAIGAQAFATLLAYPDRRFAGRVLETARRMGRKNVRTDDPTERLDTKILEVIIELDDVRGLIPGQRVTAYVRAS